MDKGRFEDTGLMVNFRSGKALQRNAQLRECNFGSWCLYDENVFCQEFEGCDRCMIKKRTGI